MDPVVVSDDVKLDMLELVLLAELMVRVAEAVTDVEPVCVVADVVGVVAAALEVVGVVPVCEVVKMKLDELLDVVEYVTEACDPVVDEAAGEVMVLLPVVDVCTGFSVCVALAVAVVDGAMLRVVEVEVCVTGRIPPT